MNKIIVAGGYGFIGKNLVSMLLRNPDNEIIIIDNLSSGKKTNTDIACENIHYIQKNISDIDVSDEIFSGVGEIYNLACIASPVKYVQNGIDVIRASTQGLMKLLDIAVKNNAKFFQASSSEVYGDSQCEKQDEGYYGNVNTFGPRACYDEGKRVAEAICYEYMKVYNIDIKIARIFNTYGPFMSADDGRVMSNFIVNALSGTPLEIYGSGTQNRSFMYIDDLLSAIESLMNSDVNIPVNIGSDQNITVIELARKILMLTDSKSEIEYTDMMENDPLMRCPDTGLIESKLSWKAETNLDEGIQKTINFFKKSYDKKS